MIGIIRRYILAIRITQIHRILTEPPITTQIRTKDKSPIIRLIRIRVRKLSLTRRILWNRRILRILRKYITNSMITFKIIGPIKRIRNMSKLMSIRHMIIKILGI